MSPSAEPADTCVKLEDSQDEDDYMVGTMYISTYFSYRIDVHTL